MKKLVSVFMLLFALNAMAASETGVCVLFKKTSENTVSKTFVHNMTKQSCETFRSLYDDVQFNVGDIHTLGNCKDYACSFPCINHFGCTCATGDCY
jgi:hypothetical protein